MKEKVLEINLPGALDLLAIAAEKGISEWDMADFSVGNDGCIHLLMKEKDPPRIKNMFVSTTSDTNYQALSFAVDWQSGEVLNTELTDFGWLEPNLHFIQRLGDGFLLLGARAYYKNKGAEKNALITGAGGEILAEHCFGDGIEQCLVDGENRIVTSYFDEGVFGNYGWDDPIGSCGLILWSAEGEQLWRNENHDICDCYAMNLDRQDHLWFYYYDDFQLVRTDYKSEKVWDPALSGSSGFLLHVWERAVLFDAGYDKHGRFIVKRLGEDSLTGRIPACFTCGGQVIEPSRFAFRDSRALLLDGGGLLYFGEWMDGVEPRA